jgi:hypothetical protein
MTELLLSIFEEASMRICLVVTLGQTLSYWGAAVVAALWLAQLHSANSGEISLGQFQVFGFSLPSLGTGIKSRFAVVGADKGADTPTVPLTERKCPLLWRPGTSCRAEFAQTAST